ncbi:hypothetical protein SAMN05443665_103084 [Actinomadura meyerae]|uniref:Uncharacterized protein n=1 Tax=Actinomadura meyerae TaxID=240840 RepID=A0A239MQH5_9ACTN|nr:hypothetical protein [Actinomadura meyerae]SNT44730.1 hypothetical protein SAMN05443665_103084 [Actinomadura meyerae]
MTLEIDVNAVHAELQAISTAMSEVTRQMGPQTWQGGSAAAFTTDLQGHNRALNRLMFDAERAVIRHNQVPLTIDPPEIPRVTPPAGKPGVASVSPSALERLETALTRAAADLPHRARMLRARLAPAHPDVPSTAPCDNAAAWCRTQAGRMRTRIMYALAETEVGPTPLIQGPVIQIPDLERFGSKEMTDLARLQARAYLKHTTHPGSGTPALMSEIARTLRENSKNTAYLSTFFSNIPPGSVAKLAYRLHRLSGTSGLTPEDKKTIGDMGTALAALSRKKDGEPVAAKALGPAGTDMPGQALLVKLSAPDVKWSSAILTDLGRAALRWRQKYPSYVIEEQEQIDVATVIKPVNQPDHEWWRDWGLEQEAKTLRQYDPALNVLGRISGQRDLTAARNLAASELESALKIENAEKAAPLTWMTRGNGETYASLLVSPDWPDGGTIAGSVIKLATTPEKGHEEEAATNAAEIMKTVSWWNDKGREKVDKLLKKGTVPDWWPWGDFLPRTDQAPDGTGHSKHYILELGPGLTSGLLAMTRMYIPALADSNRTSGGTELPNRDPVTGTVYVDIGGSDLQHFLRTFAADDRAWTQIAVDTQLYRQHVFAWGLRTGKWPLAAKRVGQLEGNLIAAYGLERLKREQITQMEFEEAKKHIAVLRDLGGSMLGATAAGATPGITDGYAIGTELALDKIKYKDYEKRVEEIKGKYSTYTDQLYLDLAHAVQLWKGTRTGDENLDAALLLWPFAGRESKQVIKAIRETWLTPAGVRPQLSGEDLIADAERAVEHNAPKE